MLDCVSVYMKQIIPEFPHTVPIHIGLKPDIDAITSQFEPYSDFNFVNMFGWDVDNSARVSLLNGNLVMLMSDYVSGESIVSFLGIHKPVDTAYTLLDEAERQTGKRELRLIPHLSAVALQQEAGLHVAEDNDDHDYVLHLEELREHHGKDFTNFRRAINRFQRQYGTRTDFKPIDLADPHTQGDIFETFLTREHQKSDNEHENELMALGRVFDYIGDLSLLGYGVEIDDELRGFIICEGVDEKWAVGHFWKADTTYAGLYRYLMHKTVHELCDQGFTHMNIEQDLGIEGLRHMKRLFVPRSSLKKYVVTDSTAA